MDKKRLKEIDILKVIAVIIVVYGHVLYNCAGIYSGFISYVHMPIFYSVSGFFLFKELNKYDLRKLIIKKTKRFLIPYFIWSFISFSANSLLIVLSEKKIDLIKIYKEFIEIFIYSRSVWFLIQIFIAHIIFIFISYFTREHKVSNIIINIIVWISLIIICDTRLFMMIKFEWLYGFLILGYFVALMGLDEKVKSINIRFVYLILFISLFAWIFITLRFSGGYSSELIFGYELKGFSISNIIIILKVLFCGFSGLLTIYLFSFLISKYRFSNILSNMGDYTLDIYLIHMMLIFLIKHLPMPSGIGYIFIISFFYALVPISFGIYILSKYILRNFKIYRMII